MSVEDQVKALEKKVAELSHELTRVSDEQQIRKLQHTYGYCCDKCLYEEVVDMFAEDSEVRFMHGVWRGKAGARRLYIESFGKRFTGRNGPTWGFLLDHPMYQDVVHVSADGTRGWGRFRVNMQAGQHYMKGPTRQWWEGALYENEYVKEDGVWKIKVLNYNPVWHADFEAGWAYTQPAYVGFFNDTQLYPKNPLGPDDIDTTMVLWPDHGVLPFHYPHPVTGKKFKTVKPAMTPANVKKKPNPAMKDGKLMMPPRNLMPPPPAANGAKPAAPAKGTGKPASSSGASAKPAPAPTAAKGGSKLVKETTPVKTGARARA